MALKGCLAQVKQQSSAVAFTDEATTTSDNLTYTITDSNKSTWDLATTIVVEDSAVPTTESYTVDYLNGTITFATATARTITVTGAYVLLTTVASAKSFAFNGSREVVDVTKFGVEFREFEPTLLTGTAELGLIYDVTSTFFSMLMNGTIKVVEYYPNSALTPIRFFALCTSNSINAPVEGIIEESISFQITKQISIGGKVMDALQKLLKASFKEETINIEGTTFIVREMNAKDKSEYENALYTFKQVGKEMKVTPNLEGAKSRLVFYTLHDEQGQKVFKDLSDLPLVDTLPSSITEKICDAASKLNGLNQEEVTKN